MTKILLVDDSKTMRRIQKNALGGIGFEDIEEAEHGEEALKKLSETDFNLILLDWNMPIMNGIDCLRAIKKGEKKDTPVIMVTSESQKSNIIEAIQAGAANYIVKPFQPKILKEKIVAVIGEG